MQQTIIFDKYGYTVTSYGNGLAYAVRHKETGAESFLQGDDAAAFRDDFDEIDSKPSHYQGLPREVLYQNLFADLIA